MFKLIFKGDVYRVDLEINVDKDLCVITYTDEGLHGSIETIEGKIGTLFPAGYPFDFRSIRHLVTGDITRKRGKYTE